MKYLFLILTSIFVYSQNIVSINEKNFDLNEFEKTQKYGLNSKGIDKTLNDFINLEVLRLYSYSEKVTENAYFDAQFNNSIIKLKDTLYYPKEDLNKYINQYIEWSKKEREAQFIILINSDPKTTLENKIKLEKIKSDINSGKLSFDEAALKYSTNYNPARFFSVFEYDSAYEHLIFNNPLGEISSVFSDESVSILTKVSNERKALGEVSLSILVIKGKENFEKANSIRKAIEGLDFIEAVKKYSEEEKSKKSNGMIAPITTSLSPKLYDLISKMEVLEVSKPILTDNDYIIYKLDGLLNYSNNDFSKKRIKEKIINSYYGNLLERKIIKELKSSNSFKFNQKDYDSYLNFAKNKDIKSIKNLRNNNFFKINSFEIPMTLICDSLVNYAAKNPKADLYSYFKTYSENRLDSDLMFYYSNYFDELPHIVKYAEKIKDGLALEYAFDILIGEKAEKDIEGQKKYFSENKKKYIFPIRANSILYTCANNEIADKVEKLVKDNKSVVEIKDLMKKNSSSDNIDLFITQGLFVENSEKFPKNTKFKKGIQRVKQAGASVIVQIKAIEESREKTFEEAQKEVIQNYTAYFLNNTIKELKSKYKISINSEAISLLEKKYKR